MEITIQQMNDLRQRIVAARNGEGEMPTREELLEAYRQLRSNRALSQSKATAKRTASAGVPLPENLADLFK